MQKSQHNCHAKEREFAVGERVMVRNLRPGPKWVVGIVCERNGPLSYVVETEDKQVWKRHADHLTTFGAVSVTELNNGSDCEDAEIYADCPTPVDDTEQHRLEDEQASVPPDSDQNDSTVEEISRTPRYPAHNRKSPERLVTELN